MQWNLWSMCFLMIILSNTALLSVKPGSVACSILLAMQKHKMVYKIRIQRQEIQLCGVIGRILVPPGKCTMHLVLVLSLSWGHCNRGMPKWEEKMQRGGMVWTSFMHSLSSSVLLDNLVYDTARTCLAPFLASCLQLGGRMFLEDDITAKSKTLCVREVPVLILIQIAS